MMNKVRLLSVFIFMGAVIAGCSINDTNTSTVEELSEEELQIAGQIIAESLSDQKDGVFASLNDAFTLPSDNGFAQDMNAAGNYSAAVFKGALREDESTTENDYSYSYDPSTGIHLVSFSRSLNNSGISKESSAELEYIYYDSDGSFIASPRIENERIDVIDYIGQRTGSIETPGKSSSYQRNDQFLINGLAGGSETLSIEGLHEGNGQFKASRKNGNLVERNYELTVEFIDVQIDNATVESNGNLKKGVTGALAYEMFISKTVNGDESIKTVNGTIEFNGDGTALLRFRNILEDFKIKLDEGSLLDDDEFEGFIRSVNTDENSFTLFNGQTLLLTGNSEISSDGDLFSLEEVASALARDIRVETKGTFGTDEAGTDIVGTVIFKYEREDIEFDDHIEEVDTDNNSFTLDNDTELFITDSTEVDEDSELSDLSQVASALQNGNKIKAEGEFLPGFDGLNNVVEVKFEYDNNDLRGVVGSADLSESSFTLKNRRIFFVNSDTEFENEDITSIDELIAALQNGAIITVEGEYHYNDDGDRIVTRIEFEIRNENDRDDEEEDSDEVDEEDFEGMVASVDTGAQSFTLTNGLQLHVNGQTRFDDGRINNLDQLSRALADGHSVEAEGEYYTSDGGENIVIEVEFDIEDDDDDD